MPYIKQDDRVDINEVITNEFVNKIKNCGDLNYTITRICIKYLWKMFKEEGETKVKIPRYQDFNEVIGVLECAKQELYRRKIVPYEDKKIAENGDVY